MASLYANENFPLKVVQALRALGHNVLTTQESGQANQSLSDKAILAFARQGQMILLTLNRRDFIKLHEDDPDHAGIVVCTQDPDIQGQADRIHQAILAQAPLSRKLIRINRPNL